MDEGLSVPTAVAASAPRSPAFSTSAVVALAVGVAGVALLGSVPPLAGALGAVAIALALRSRTQLKLDAELRGARLSLGGFLLGAVSVAIGILPLVAGYLLAGFSQLAH
jgi:hypothetical protein